MCLSQGKLLGHLFAWRGDLREPELYPALCWDGVSGVALHTALAGGHTEKALHNALTGGHLRLQSE